MKNKEEPSIDLSRENPCLPADQNFPGRVRLQTPGSPVRPDDAATASIEKPALSLIPESLLEKLVSPANIEAAWKNVKANGGAPGPDGITVKEFPAWLRPRWSAIRQQLLDSTYQPQPVRRVTPVAVTNMQSTWIFRSFSIDANTMSSWLVWRAKSTTKRYCN